MEDLIPLTNYHTHNELCDGRGDASEYVAAAQQKGFKALGFTSHAPLPFANEWTLKEENLLPYIKKIRSLSEPEGLEIYLGLEIDFIPGKMGPAEERWKTLGLDYTIGSVHSLRPGETDLSIDGPDNEFLALLNGEFNGDGTAMAVAYFEYLEEMIKAGGFTILGHMDLVKKKNLRFSFLDEKHPLYRGAALKVLDRLACTGIILEINTGGMYRKATNEVYPSPEILKEAFSRDIPLMINSDAHTPEALDFHIPESRQLAREAGYRKIMMLLDRKWQSVTL